VCATLIGTLLGWQLRRDWQQTVQQELVRNELYARLVDAHATAQIDSAALALNALATQLAASGRAPEAFGPAQLQPLLVGLTHVRELAVLDTAGTVLASSQPDDAGLRIDLDRLGRPPAPGGEWPGPWVAGRGLRGLATAAAPAAGSAASAPPAPPGVGFMPLMRASSGPRGQPLWLLAIVHPDALTSPLRVGADHPERSATVLHLSGTVLTSTAALGPGTDLASNPLVARAVQGAEHGSGVGPGVLGENQVVAFRASRLRPLLTVIERPRASVWATWWRDARRLAAAGATGALAVAVLGLVAAASLRARERARRSNERAQAEVARREREMSVVLGSLQELVLRTDAAGTVTYVNERWRQVGGDAVAGQSLPSLAATEADAAVLASLVDRGPQAPVGLRQAEVALRTPDGVVRRFAVALMPLRHGSELAGFVGSAVDLTERLEIQQQLRAEASFNALMLELSPLPTSMLDRSGRYLRVNRAWELFTGRRRDEVLGRAARDYLPPEQAARHDAVDDGLRANGGQVQYEAPARAADGSLRELLISKAAVPGADGRVEALLVSFLDITRLRAAERETRAARDLAEEASRAKSEFIANMSHELRTPLQSIIGFSELGMVRGRGEPRLAAMFTDIHASGQRMLALVNDLLDVSRLESAVGTFHLERTDLRPLLREVLRELDPLLARRGLRIAADISAGALVAKVDPLRIQQVMRNVLANAIKFSPEGGTIEVRADARAEGTLEFAVRDHGPGIPPNELESIFEAFVQSSRTKDGSGGTGLGLAICRTIVQAHGGRIHAEPAEGGGSRFVVTLPARGFADTTLPAPLD
jgi:PAS domain S-box-containing protein